MTKLENIKATYEVHNIAAISVEQSVSKTGKTIIDKVSIDGREVTQSDRFWNSLYSRFGFGKNVFNYFSPAEVFDRISERRRDDDIQFCLIEDSNNSTRPLALAVSSPDKPIIRLNEAADILSNGSDMNLLGGYVSSQYTPIGESQFEIAGDAFDPRYEVGIPIDGYGSAEATISCIRQICSNGMIGYGKVFSSKIIGGKTVQGSRERLVKVCEGFGNDEGYDAFRRRFQSASESYASLREVSKVGNIVDAIIGHTKNVGGDTGSLKKIVDNFERASGSPSSLYGIITDNAVSAKRLATLPTRTTVYDLINFASEIGTHYANDNQAKKINAALGSLISAEYDLEGSAKSGKDHIDLWLEADENQGSSLAVLEEQLVELEN